MSGAVADDPALRQDLHIARQLGVTVRQFWGLTDQPDFDQWERALWRAYTQWEADLCPGCGQPMSESIWPAKKDRPKYRGGFHECSSCLAIEQGQIEQSRLDEQAQKARGKDAPPIPTRHRHWFASKHTPEPEETTGG